MIKYLLEKEFKQLLRNPMLPRMLLVFPCIIPVSYTHLTLPTSDLV